MTLIDKDEALLPCPFCKDVRTPVAGGWLRGLAEEMQTEQDVWGWAVRHHCGAQGPECDTEAEAIAAWNRRALPARGVGVKQLQWKQAGGDIKAGDGFSAWPDLLGAPITIYRKHDGWWLSSDCKTHPTLDAAKAAAQADYEARILAALAPTDAAHVNETPKSEHDGADVLTAAQAREAALREAASLVDDLGQKTIATIILALIAKEAAR